MGSPFVALDGRARWATLLLAATIVVDVLAIGSNVREITAINGFLAGSNLDPGALTSSDHGQSLVALLKFIALLASGIAFIRWFYAAYRNVTSLAPAEVRFKPGWAIGAWFVPVLNLWRPKQIANEIWHVSELQPAPAGEHASRLGKTTTLLALWWGFWIAGAFVGNVSSRLLFGSDTLVDIRDSDKLDIVALSIDIAAAALAILVIDRITNRLAGTTVPPPAEPGTPHEAGFATP